MDLGDRMAHAYAQVLTTLAAGADNFAACPPTMKLAGAAAANRPAAYGADPPRPAAALLPACLRAGAAPWMSGAPRAGVEHLLDALRSKPWRCCTAAINGSCSWMSAGGRCGSSCTAAPP